MAGLRGEAALTQRRHASAVTYPLLNDVHSRLNDLPAGDPSPAEFTETKVPPPCLSGAPSWTTRRDRRRAARHGGPAIHRRRLRARPARTQPDSRLRSRARIDHGRSGCNLAGTDARLICRSRCTLTSPWGIRQKQTGAHHLTVGGALAANIHGRGLTCPPFSADVVSFHLVTATGDSIICSRERESELFSLVVGGYGLVGVVVAVTLQLVPRQKVERVVSLLSLAELLRAFETRIAQGYTFGDFQFATDPKMVGFMSDGIFSCYRPVDNETHAQYRGESDPIVASGLASPALSRTREQASSIPGIYRLLLEVQRPGLLERHASAQYLARTTTIQQVLDGISSGPAYGCGLETMPSCMCRTSPSRAIHGRRAQRTFSGA